MSSVVARNTTYLGAAYIFQKITAFVYFALIARHFGADLLGKYAFSVFFVILLSVLIDLGLNQVLTREIAKYPEKTMDYFNTSFTFKIIIGAVVYILAIVLVKVLGYPPITQKLVMITGLLMFFDALTQTTQAVMRGHQKLRYESISTIIYQFAEISIGAIVLGFNLPIYGLVIAKLVGSIATLSYSLSRIIKILKVKIALVIKKEVLKNLAKLALPFFIAGVFIKVYSHIDSILITKLASDEAMGFYSVPYKLVFSLQVLPVAFGASVYPAFSHFWLKSRDLLKNTFERSLFYLMIIALPITFGTIALASQIIIKVYSDQFSPSILSLQILIISSFFSFLTFPVGALLNACDRQKTNTRNIGIVMVVNIIINLFLIPRYTFIGASIAALVSQALLFFLGMIYVSGITRYNKKYLAVSFLKILFASIFIGLIAFFLKDYIHTIYNIIISAIIYFGVIYATRTITKKEVREMINLIRPNKTAPNQNA
ncbi:flippase [Candidatus Falkowbacteria bacterium]|nr:flippase [Candidatus Falkowbacteria bacterium]